MRLSGKKPGQQDTEDLLKIKGLIRETEARAAALATLDYKGTPNYNGPDTLTVVSTDSLGASDTDTVAITVGPVPDAPIAVQDNYTINEDSGALTLTPLVNDSDPDGNTIAFTSITRSWLYPNIFKKTLF